MVDNKIKQGEELKLAIKGSGLTMEKAAQALKMSRTTLYTYLDMDVLPTEFLHNVKMAFGIHIETPEQYREIRQRTGYIAPDDPQIKKPASDDTGEIIALLRQVAEAEKTARIEAQEAKLAEREAKEAYKEIARLKEQPAGEYVTKERFAIGELRTQVLRAWTVETLAKHMKVPQKSLVDELGKRIEETLQLYMQGTSTVENNSGMLEKQRLSAS